MPDIQLRVQSGYEWLINGGPRFLDFEKPEKQVMSKFCGTVTFKKSDGWTYS